ncbi:hypothetical protein BHE74_00055731, partial [Ensete ventricosum]
DQRFPPRRLVFGSLLLPTSLVPSTACGLLGNRQLLINSREMEQFDEVGRCCQRTNTLLPGTRCRKRTAPSSSSPVLSVSPEHGQRSKACPMAAACSL